MKMTPAEIRQKTFETSFRGYEKKEVSDFLEIVSQVVDQLNQEVLELKARLQQVESDAKRLKDVEDSLFRTLKTAEDTGASIIEEANEAADQIIAEANQTAEHASVHANQLMTEAQAKAQEQASIIIKAAETKAKETIMELREGMEGLVRSYESLADQREALVKSLKRTQQDLIHQVELSESQFSRIDAKAHKQAIEELSRTKAFTLENLSTQAPEPEYIPEAPSEDPLAEMEVIEEDLDLEVHDSTPDVAIEKETAETEKKKPVEEPEAEIEVEKELAQAEVETSEIQEKAEEQIGEQEEAPKASHQGSEPEEDPKKQSGSFFDQFD